MSAIGTSGSTSFLNTQYPTVAVSRLLPVKVSEAVSIYDGGALGSTNGGLTATYGAAADDTAAINTMIAAVSAASVAAGVMGHIVFPTDVYSTNGILVASNVWLDFGQSVILKRAAGTSAATNSLMRTIEVWSGTSYYGTFANIRITGGTFKSNGFNCPAHIIHLLFVQNLLIEYTTVVHSSGAANWAYCIGGRQVRGELLNVLGGSQTFQDGIHVYHGQDITIRPGYVQSGDDCVPIGCEPTDTLFTSQPTGADPIRRVTILPFTGTSSNAALVKIYVNTGAPDNALWEVTEVSYQKAIGVNNTYAGVVIKNYNHATQTVLRIRNIDVDADCYLGTTVGGGSSADGAQVFTCEGADVVSAKIQSGDYATGNSFVSGSYLALVKDCGKVDLELDCQFMRVGGIYANNVTDLTLIEPYLVGQTGMTGNAVNQVNSAVTINTPKVSGVPNTVDIIGGSTGTGSLVVNSGYLSHINTSGTAYAVNLGSTVVTYMNMIGVNTMGSHGGVNETAAATVTTYNVLKCPGNTSISNVG